MTILAAHIIERLIQIEAEIHYSELPPPNLQPFVAIDRKSSSILSAPHGAITHRGRKNEIWHDEDEYTAGMALLLSELCHTSVIATTWRTEDSDPNEHNLEQSAYKQALQRLVVDADIRPHWFIDLHGAAKDNDDHLSHSQLIDLGTGKNGDNYLSDDVLKHLIEILERSFGKGITDRQDEPGFPAGDPPRMAAFAHQKLGLYSVQIEMKPSLRVPQRRIDSSMYGKDLSKNGGPYSAPPQNVLGMMQAIVDFISYLNALK